MAEGNAPLSAIKRHRFSGTLSIIQLTSKKTITEPCLARRKYNHGSITNMGKGVKRKSAQNDASATKKLKTSAPGSLVKRDLLRHHYPLVQTLREYLIAKLPSSSRIRRRKITSLGLQLDCNETDGRLSRLLDSCLVCSSNSCGIKDPARWEQWISFSQRVDESYIALSGGISGVIYSQSEVCSILYCHFTSSRRTDESIPGG